MDSACMSSWIPGSVGFIQHHQQWSGVNLPLCYPDQALVRERIKDWGGGLCKALGKRLVELTGGHACLFTIKACRLSQQLGHMCK